MTFCQKIFWLISQLKFFESLGRRTKLSDYGIDKIEAAKLISERFKERNCTLGEKSNITPDEVYKILMDC